MTAEREKIKHLVEEERIYLFRDGEDSCSSSLSSLWEVIVKCDDICFTCASEMECD